MIYSANIFRALPTPRIFKSMKIQRMQNTSSDALSIEWNASCVLQLWRRFRHRTRYVKKRKGDRIARVTIQFKDLERHATKKSIPLLPPPAEGWRRYGWRLFSVEVDEGSEGDQTGNTCRYKLPRCVTSNVKEWLRAGLPHPCENFTLISHFAYSLVFCVEK